MQVALALVGTAAALARFAGGGPGGWLVGALLLVSVIPFTLVVIMPTNKRLLDESLSLQSADVPALLDAMGASPRGAERRQPGRVHHLSDPSALG